MVSKLKSWYRIITTHCCPLHHSN